MPSTAPPARVTLRAHAKTSTYASHALDAIARISNATAPPALLEALANATAAIGASASLYAAAVPEGRPEPTCLSLFAGHPAYVCAQNDLGSLLVHPWFRFARTHSIAGSNRRVHIDTAPDLAAIELASRYGFRSCFIVPTPAGIDLQRTEMLCLGCEEEDAFEGAEARVVRTLARALAAELHDWLTRYLQRRMREHARLDASDVSLLALELKGLGTKEIAQLTGLSLASVDSRFHRINVRLHCTSRRASANLASAYGLMELA